MHRMSAPQRPHAVQRAQDFYVADGLSNLVEGKVEMTRNFSLEAWEMQAGFVLTCQAVPQSERVVLDYDQV